MKLLISIAMVTVVVGGVFACGSTPPLRVAEKVASAPAPPSITDLIDLGSLPLPEVGELDIGRSDGRFTPGEWMWVKGTHLHADPAVTIDDRPVSVEGYLKDGGILIRVPTGLTIAEAHLLKLVTASGTATAQFTVCKYIVSSDTDGNRIRFFRVDSREPHLADDDAITIEQKRALYHVVSPSGGIAYAVGVEDNAVTAEGRPGVALSLAVIHLGAPDGPALFSSQTLVAAFRPTDMAVASGDLLAILTAKELLLVDTSEVGHPALVSTTSLPAKNTESLFTEAVFFNNGERLAIVDAAENTLLFYDVTNRAAPVQTGSVSLFEMKRPYIADLAADPHHADRIWIVAGPTLRALRKKLGGAVQTVVSKAVGFVGGLLHRQRDGDAPTSETEETTATPTDASLPRLMALEIGKGTAEVVSETMLPRTFAPLSLLPSSSGDVLVSGVDGEGYTQLETEHSGQLQDLAERLFAQIKKVTHFGQIYDVNPAAHSVEKRLEGIQVFMDMAQLPDGRLIYSGFHLSGHTLPPHVGVSWGIGVEDIGFFNQRRLDWKFILPPYAYGQVSLQP